MQWDRRGLWPRLSRAGVESYQSFRPRIPGCKPRPLRLYPRATLAKFIPFHPDSPWMSKLKFLVNVCTVHMNPISRDFLDMFLTALIKPVDRIADRRDI